jgi:hypothetical protein
MQLPQPQVNLQATLCQVSATNPQATSSMGDNPPRLRLPLSRSRIKKSLVDTAYVPEAS